MYRVEYDTIALMSDGSTGNVSQGKGTLYTDHSIEGIPRALNEELAAKKRVAIISSIDKLRGHVIAAKQKEATNAGN